MITESYAIEYAINPGINASTNFKTTSQFKIKRFLNQIFVGSFVFNIIDFT